MAYLTPEIEALSISFNTQSLVRPTVSCGIFQDWDYNDKRSKLYQQQKAENTKD